ncbi:hypothetical protein ACI3KS_18435 [Microbacterium sp. ZW T5_45]|uniref:hypothetical protein n=1 Tax=Microbacterium sp. ZW T5_45 TaxID=3378080 RepID=UPI003851A570
MSVVANDVRRAANIAGFEGGQGLGEKIAQKLLSIHSRLADFTEYQKQLGSLITQAHAELESTANGVDGLPGTGLTSEQQSTINMASQTDSPVQVRPGVTMTSAEAKQYYLDQAAAAQEEQARQMTAALDARLQEIIDSMPATDYDEPEPTDDPSGNDGPGSNPTVNYPGINTGGGDGGYDGPGIIGNNDGGGNNGTDNNNDNNNGGNDGDDTDPPRVVDPPRVYPPVYPPVDPPVYPPGPHDPTGPGGNGGGDDTPRIDGEIGGVTGGGGGGTGFPGGVTGTVGGGAGGLSAGVGGSLGAAGVVGGAAGLAGRLGGGALLGGVGGVGGVGGLGGAGGVGGVGGVGGAGTGAGAGGVVTQSGAANGGRGGMVGGAAAGGGAGGGSDKRNRRRGQDLLAFEVEPDDDQIIPDLGAAGSAGRSASDGREELGW